MKDSDQLPQQLCLACVSELNKCFAFREKCVRTNKTLRTYLDLESDDEDDEAESEQEEVIVKKYTRPRRSKVIVHETKEDRYEEIEVTQEMVDAAKAENQEETGLVLEMEELCHNLLNPTSSKIIEDKNEFVYIIQDISDPTSTTRMIQSPTPSFEKQDEKSPEGFKDKYKCTTCEMEFVRKKNFDNHMRRFHENDDEEIPAKRLRLKLTNEKDEQFKQNLEENPEAKKCKTCGALYLNEKSLKLHERRNACTQKSYQCDVCNKVFTDRKMFTDHTKNHPQMQQQVEVEEPVDPLKKFQCQTCPRSFKMMSTLKDHVRTHTGDKPFKCTICGRGFSQNTNLKQHLRRHTQMKPFKCSYENCTAAFVSKGELDSHNRTHTGKQFK